MKRDRLRLLHTGNKSIGRTCAMKKRSENAGSANSTAVSHALRHHRQQHQTAHPPRSERSSIAADPPLCPLKDPRHVLAVAFLERQIVVVSLPLHQSRPLDLARRISNVVSACDWGCDRCCGGVDDGGLHPRHHGRVVSRDGDETQDAPVA